jgi:hypothetical protein
MSKCKFTIISDAVVLPAVPVVIFLSNNLPISESSLRATGSERQLI